MDVCTDTGQILSGAHSRNCGLSTRRINSSDSYQNRYQNPVCCNCVSFDRMAADSTHTIQHTDQRRKVRSLSLQSFSQKPTKTKVSRTDMRVTKDFPFRTESSRYENNAAAMRALQMSTCSSRAETFHGGLNTEQFPDETIYSDNSLIKGISRVRAIHRDLRRIFMPTFLISLEQPFSICRMCC